MKNKEGRLGFEIDSLYPFPYEKKYYIKHPSKRG